MAILGGSKALFDVLPKKVKSMKASRDKFKAETAHRADTLVTGSAVKDINAHIEILQAVRMAKETGQQFDVVKAFGLKAEKTEVGKIFTEAELSGSKSFIDHVNDNFEEQLQDPRVLHMTDKNEVPTPEYKHDINYDELDKYGIGNTGKNPLEEAKMQKVNDWAAQLTEDVGVPVRRVDMEGNEIIEIKSLKDTVLEYNNDIEGMNKLMECGNV